MRLPDVEDERLVHRVGGLRHQGDDVLVPHESLERRFFTVDETNSDLPVVHDVLPPDDGHIAVMDAGRIHTVAAHPQPEILMPAVQVGVGIPLDVFRRIDGRTRSDPPEDGDAFQVCEFKRYNFRERW